MPAKDRTQLRRCAAELDGLKGRFVFLKTRKRCSARRRVNLVEFAVGAVVANERRIDRREPGEVGDDDPSGVDV